MTRADLEAHRYLVLQRKIAEQTLSEQGAGFLGAQQFDAMPHAHTATRVTENRSISLDIALSEYARLDGAVNKSLAAGIRDWVCAIPDFRTKMIIAYYFLDGLTWQEVAWRMGGGNTEEGVKAVYYRYLPAD